MPQIDIVVCCYNEARYLPALLNSFCEQTVDRNCFRILLVDNGSSDNTREIVERYQDRLNIQYIFEPRLGLNIARNAGFHHASTTYVAFTDGDAVLSPGWVETILKVIEERSPDLFGGPYFPYYIGPKPAWFKDQYNSHDKGSDMRLLTEDEFLSGINMIWKHQILERLGGFNNAVGLAGRGLARGDETNLILLARSKFPDFTVLYWPELVVYHLTRHETYSMFYWIRRNFVQGYRNDTIWSDGNRQNFVAAAKRFLYFLRQLIRSATASRKRDKTLFPAWQNYIYEQVLPEVYRNGKLFRQVIRALKK